MAPGGTTRAATSSLAARQLRSIRRMPSAFVPSLIFPIFTTIAFSGAFGAITKLPFFPTDNALSWFVPLAALQGAAFAGLFTAFGVVRDFEDGFVDRLLLSPMPRRSLLYGPVTAGVFRGVFPVVATLIVGWIGGMAVPGGVLGIFWLVLACEGIAVVAALWSLGLAFRFQSMQAAPLMQIGLFFALFLTTSQMPLEGLSGWLKVIARINPFTYVLALGRQGFLGDTTWDTTWKGLLALGGVGAALFVFAARGVRRVVR
jgi:ABC-2 type transport system permease protein